MMPNAVPEPVTPLPYGGPAVEITSSLIQSGHQWLAESRELLRLPSQLECHAVTFGFQLEPADQKSP
jgi:hypothetical protein